MYKPMLAVNEQPKENDIKYPKLCSTKLDGIRTEFKDGDMISRSLKKIQSTRLRYKFTPLMIKSLDTDIIFDGEIYEHGRTFQDISRAVMTEDYNDDKTIKRLQRDKKGNLYKKSKEYILQYFKELINDMKFYCFDCYVPSQPNLPFIDRYNLIKKYLSNEDNVVIVNQVKVNCWKEIQDRFKKVLDQGYEGLILKDPKSRYKCGRTTFKENTMFKFKPYKTVDAKVVGFVQATQVREDAEKKINELGRSVTSKKKADRIPINRCSAVIVNWETVDGIKKLKVNLSMTNEEKQDVWENQGKYMGKYIEFKFLDIGVKELPRHPNSIRWRFDKDE